MRDLNECRAEVFRRSEIIIKERRKRAKHILSLCLPLCFVFAVWSATMLPAMMPAGADNASGESIPEAPSATGAAGAASYTYVQIQGGAQNPGFSANVVDENRVLQIFYTLSANFDAANGSDIFYQATEGDRNENVGVEWFGQGNAEDAGDKNQNLKDDPEGDDDAKGDDDPEGDRAPWGEDGPPTATEVYAITFFDENEEKTSYNLCGKMLVNTNSGASVLLTDADYDKVKTVLGIS